MAMEKRKAATSILDFLIAPPGYSHEQGYRHIYTNKHKLKVENACKKLKSKAKLLISSLNSAGFEGAAVFSEINKTIWCYACNEEVLSHWCDDNEVVILNYAAFHHFACMTADSAGLYSITCPVEQKVRKVMPLEKLPPDGKALFSDVNKVLEESLVLFKLLEKRIKERMVLIDHLSIHIKNISKESSKLMRRISVLHENGFNCSRCGYLLHPNLNTSVGSMGSNHGVHHSISETNDLNYRKQHHALGGHSATRLSADSCRRVCDSHQKAVTNFLTDNRLLKKEDAKLYSIDSATAKRIMEKIDTESKRFRQDIEQKILEESERLKNLEARQLHIANMNAPHRPTTSQSNRLIHAAVEVDCDVNNGSPCEIGPSLEDFHQHLKSVKNKKEEQLLEKRGYNNTATTMYPKDIPTKSQKKDAGGDSDVPASVQVQPYKRRRKD